jgi:hypothetical protein
MDIVNYIIAVIENFMLKAMRSILYTCFIYIINNVRIIIDINR